MSSDPAVVQVSKLKLHPRAARDAQKKLPFYKQVVAASRSLGAKQLRVPVFNYYSPPLSAIAIVLGFIVFFTGQFRRVSDAVRRTHRRHSVDIRSSPLLLAQPGYGT